MKSIIELLKLVKDNKELMRTGLCSIVYQLRSSDIITLDESSLILDYLKRNRPVEGSIYYEAEWADTDWHWTPWNWESRERWLNAQIEELSKETIKL